MAGLDPCSHYTLTLSSLCLSGAVKTVCPGRKSHTFSRRREWLDSRQVRWKSITLASRLRFSDFDALSRRRGSGKRKNLCENSKKSSISACHDFDAHSRRRRSGKRKNLCENSKKSNISACHDFARLISRNV